MPMIKPKLTLLQMQSKGIFRHAIELSQATLGKAPKGFNAVDTAATSHELILAMIDPKMFIRNCPLRIFHNRRELDWLPRIDPQTLKPGSSFTRHGQSKRLLGAVA